MSRYEPALHEHIELGTRVRIKTESSPGFRPGEGVVVGIAAIHVVFTYIVLLDSIYHFTDEYGKHKSVAVPGPNLETLKVETKY